MTALSAETLSEHELIAAARDGDDRAFEELYARYSGRITGFIHARVRDHGRSEDVAQDVFISALRRLRANAQEIQFKPWLYEIAKNACIDEHRRTTRVHEVSFDGGDVDESASRLPSRAPTPPAAVETKQALTDLRGAFGGLSDTHHQLLVLREFEGLSYDEIGERTGMSRQMVESALFRARRKLTEEYEELASGRRCRQIQSTIDDGRARSAHSLGVRERRVFARHLAHCQACRVSAHLAGVDETLVTRRGIGAKIAALLPFPLWHWTRGSARSRPVLAPPGGHPAVQALSHAAEPAAATSLGGAAVAAAVLALAGTGAVPPPAAVHPERRSGPAATVRSFAPRRAAVAPAAIRPAAGPGRPTQPAARHGRRQLGAGTMTRTTGRVPARPSGQGQRTPQRPGPAGRASGQRAKSGGTPPPAGPVASAPTGLGGASGSGAAKTLSGLAHRGSHLLPGLPLALIPASPASPAIPGAVTQTTGSTLAGGKQAAGGVVPGTPAPGAAAGAARAVTGAAAHAVSGPAANTPAQVAGTAAKVAGTAAKVAGTAAKVAGTAAQVTGTTAQVAGTAAKVAGTAAKVTGTPAKVTGTPAKVASPVSQTAAASAAVAAKTVAPLLPGASGH